MANTIQNVARAVKSGREEVRGRLEGLAGELEATAVRVRKLIPEYLDDPQWELQSATIIARELGVLLRQPLGQNAQELLLRDLSSLSYDQGALQALRLTEVS